jgi:calcium-dependent protein kinase
LQQAALTYIVCQLSNKNELLELQKTFNEIDQNSDGQVSKDEMMKAYQILLGSQMDKESIVEEVDKIFLNADRDGDGTLSFTEWQSAGINKGSVLQTSKLKAAF